MMLSRYFQQKRCFTECSLATNSSYQQARGINRGASWDSFSTMTPPKSPETSALFEKHQQSVFELLHSSFFTNNPLLYVSHYSEILCVSASPPSQEGCGYDMQQDYTFVPGSGLPGNCALTSRRELVERLECEPLFDYLIQNGVIESSLAENLKKEPSAAKVNLTVLRQVETKDAAVFELFINALRQTGQHHLANLLDGSGRIKALSGSGKIRTMISIIFCRRISSLYTVTNLFFRTKFLYGCILS